MKPAAAESLTLATKNVIKTKSALLTASPNYDIPMVPIEMNPYLHAATSDNTRRAYRADIHHFMNWGGVLPTDVTTLLRYLQEHAATHNHRTLSRRLIAISHWHQYQVFADPTQHPTVKKTLTGIKNTHGKPKAQAPALTLENLHKLILTLTTSNRLLDIRNAALLQVGYFGAFRRSELVNLKWEDITWSEQGIEILIPKSKTDQGGEGQVCAIPYGNNDLCAVTALLTWQRLAQLKTGFVFRRIGRSGIIQTETIDSKHVNTILKQVAKRTQLDDAESYSSHSLRRGFATEASRKGAPFSAIRKQGRWKSDSTVLGYIESGKRFDENAVNTLFKTE